MKVALFSVVGVGIVIGLAVPTAKPQAATPLAVPAAAPTVQEPPRETVLERSPGGHFYTFAQVNGEPVRFIVDTGASTIALSEEDARRAHVPFDPATFEPVGQGASGIIQGQRVTVGAIDLDGKRGEALSGVVMQGATMSLLGQNYLRRLNVQIAGDTMTLR